MATLGRRTTGSDSVTSREERERRSGPGKRRDMKISQELASAIRPERFSGSAAGNRSWDHRRLRPGLWSLPCWNNSTRKCSVRTRDLAPYAPYSGQRPPVSGEGGCNDSGTSSAPTGEMRTPCKNRTRPVPPLIQRRYGQAALDGQFQGGPSS